MEHERLFADVAQALDGELVSFRQLEGGSSANVWRLNLRSDAGERAVVFRQHHAGELKGHEAGVAGMEYQLQLRLVDLGFPVARPLYLDEANRFLVTEFVEGTAVVNALDVPSAIEQMVGLLSRIHALEPSLVADTGLAPLEDPRGRLASCLPSTAQGEQLGTLLNAGQIALHTNAPVLMHGDYWPGNVLWNDGSIAALIDWEDACLGDPLADLACARVELLCQYGEVAMTDFSDRYLLAAPHLDTRSLPLWECYVSGTALASMHLWGLDPAEESRRRALTESFFNDATQRLL